MGSHDAAISGRAGAQADQHIGIAQIILDSKQI
jgi:hypothetical protein